MGKEPKPLVYCLLVDDREQNLIALEALLQGEGISLLKARSGREALELLLKHEVALALIDVQMPEMDGFELAELMRGSERTRGVPIIFLTADSSNQQRRFRGYEAGAVDFLQKPIETEILKSKAGIFFDLFRQRQEVARQRDELASMMEENNRLLEESRQYSLALQQADRRKDEFLATLAHELRNPLAPILSAVQFMRLTEGTNEESEEIHEIVERQVNHLVRLVDDLLEVSRITSGKIQLKRERVDLNEAIRNAVDTSRPQLDSGKHQLTLHLPVESPIVDGDMVRLTQIFANLLNNAAKYTPDGGHISIGVRQDDNHVEVSVRDTGMGIPAEMLSHVFDMFTQINRHLKRAQGGLGIGLTLVKRLVELHEGSVGVTSAGEGQGTEFTVRLPLLDQAIDQDAQSPSEGESSAKEHRILLIDDNKDALSCLRMLIKIHGNPVATATSGEEGIDQIASFKPTIIFLDLGMPGMDGFETARRIRQLPEGKNVMLVALTGWGQEEDRQRTKQAGFDHHIVKPVSSQILRELLAATRAVPDSIC